MVNGLRECGARASGRCSLEKARPAEQVTSEEETRPKREKRKKKKEDGPQQVS